MSYYILPKKKRHIQSSIDYNERSCTPIISQSLHHYIEETEKQIQINIYEKEQEREKELVENELFNVLINKEYTIKYITSILNPYEFVFMKVPDSKYSVSKLKPASNLFYIFMEILNTFRLLDSYQHKPIKTLHFGKETHTESTMECLHMLREEYPDIHMSDCDTSLFIEKRNNIDLLYFEIDANNVDSYIEKMVTIVCNILTFQAMNGSTIIRVHELYHKPILDCLYIVTGMFDKVYIIKPNVSNIFKSERYIICKNMDCVPNMQLLHDLRNVLLKTAEMNNERRSIHSILPYSLPLYFVNKIEEANIMVGHQQLYVMDQLISVIKNKNIDEKLETLKKFHIQKCIQWCDKYKIPYNKCLEKVNIFLPAEEPELEPKEEEEEEVLEI